MQITKQQNGISLCLQVTTLNVTKLTNQTIEWQNGFKKNKSQQYALYILETKTQKGIHQRMEEDTAWKQQSKEYRDGYPNIRHLNSL